MIRPLVLLLSIGLGAWLGWICGAAGGLMVAYLSAVFGASVGLFVGRKIQRNLND
ncbi:hypothetical protein SAMN02745165_03435 [Malonomonas rubra DSM 5091]|uniref:Uncharacterized protein n=1 Tax=Malonomonas rubra DSM 5091 TaxID=1122189 RepID=A0A1M6MXN3_MALRU|nr:hypothetical protein [Malonomonas rubra]SHJ88206.1 hypothetical protein SAMN02745165_03435 [Malonomonas rubra DSM 5091]